MDGELGASDSWCEVSASELGFPMHASVGRNESLRA